MQQMPSLNLGFKAKLYLFLYAITELDFQLKFKFGIGLNSMKERAEELGGNCEITNSKLGGICVSAKLPIHIN